MENKEGDFFGSPSFRYLKLIGLCFFAVGEVSNGGSHEDSGKSAYDYAYAHCEGECANCFTAEEEDANEHDKS